MCSPTFMQFFYNIIYPLILIQYAHHTFPYLLTCHWKGFDFNKSIKQAIAPMPRPLRKRPQGGGHGRWTSTSPYPYTPSLPTPTHFPSLPSHSRTPLPYVPNLPSGLLLLEPSTLLRYTFINSLFSIPSL